MMTEPTDQASEDTARPIEESDAYKDALRERSMDERVADLQARFAAAQPNRAMRRREGHRGRLNS